MASFRKCTYVGPSSPPEPSHEDREQLDGNQSEHAFLDNTKSNNENPPSSSPTPLITTNPIYAAMDFSQYYVPLVYHSTNSFYSNYLYGYGTSQVTNEKKHNCPVCYKSFTRRAAIKIHMRVHTGERPFVCPYCQKSFSQSGNKRAHMRIHQDVRPYSCEICKKTFIQKSGLNNHMKSHQFGRAYVLN